MNKVHLQDKKKKLNWALYFTSIFAVNIFAIAYIIILIDLFHYKFFQDTVVIFATEPSYLEGGSFSSARFLLEPYLFLLELLGVRLDNYGLYEGVDFNVTNIYFLAINSFIFWTALRIYDIKPRRIWTFLFCALIFLLYVPYIGVPGKETNTLLLGIVLYLGTVNQRKFNWKTLLSGALLIIYAAGGRYYYIPFFLIYMSAIALDRKLLPKIAVAAIVAGYFMTLNPDIRLIIQYARPDLTGESNSFIPFPFEDDSHILFLFNRIYLLGQLLVPTLLASNILYWPYLIFGVFTTYLLLKGWGRKSETVEYRCAMAILAFFIVQALFEPDFGSIFRHRAFIIPFIISMGARLSFFRPSEPATVEAK